MKIKHVILILSVAGLAYLFLAPAPGGVHIGPAIQSGDVPASIRAVEAAGDPLAGVHKDFPDLPGHDDVVFDAAGRTAYASGMDGWIWKLDLQNATAEAWVRPPVNPAGMRFANAREDTLLVCASRLGGDGSGADANVGLYEVDLASAKITPLLLRLPLSPDGAAERVYAAAEQTAVALESLDAQNSRPFSLCNDLAVSGDGKRIYLTEPFVRADAAMGSGAVPEAIGLYPHGKLWRYDREERTVSLVLDGFTFVDGILLEDGINGGEASVLFTETTKFRMMRAHLTGTRAGTADLLYENLPGLADGLDRDERGRIWIGIIKKRSGLMNFVHANPWIKPLLLRIPQNMLPISKTTGLLILDPSARQPLYFTMHDGSAVTDISVAVPHGGRAYLPSFDRHSRGLYSLAVDSMDIREPGP